MSETFFVQFVMIKICTVLYNSFWWYEQCNFDVYLDLPGRHKIYFEHDAGYRAMYDAL